MAKTVVQEIVVTIQAHVTLVLMDLKQQMNVLGMAITGVILSLLRRLCGVLQDLHRRHTRQQHLRQALNTLRQQLQQQ
jgi:hypothetical protein